MEKESGPEKVFRVGRNVNLAVALGSAGIALAIAGANPILGGYAALNGAQAGGFELLRRNSKKKRKTKKPTR